MLRLRTIVLGLTLLPISGCNDDKIVQLEKQNEELKVQMVKQNAAADFDLQAKCSNAAKTWFNTNYAGLSREKTTSYLDYTNHYNKASNKCFISVGYHRTVGMDGSWMSDYSLWDIYENNQYGRFAEEHFISTTGNGLQKKVTSCVMLDKNCSTIGEFNGLMQPYMSN